MSKRCKEDDLSHMACIDPEIGEFLFAYDQLTASDAVKLGEHLRVCGECATKAARFKRAIEVLRSEINDHIRHEELVEYAGTDSNHLLSAERTKRIEDHLLICSYCRENLARCKAIDELLEASIAGKPLPMPDYWTEERDKKFRARMHAFIKKELKESRVQYRAATAHADDRQPDSIWPIEITFMLKDGTELVFEAASEARLIGLQLTTPLEPNHKVFLVVEGKRRVAVKEWEVVSVCEESKIEVGAKDREGIKSRLLSLLSIEEG
jgi:hypothetical protein